MGRSGWFVASMVKKRHIDGDSMRGRVMDDRAIRAFVAVAELGSVQAAAAELNYSQARVSQQVFTRTGRGMALNNRGIQVLPIARLVLHAQSLMAGPDSAPLAFPNARRPSDEPPSNFGSAHMR
jgi:hypothetical protein